MQSKLTKSPNGYKPRLNDYVKWNKKHGIEGWVYFTDQSYITIETQTKPKHPDDQPHGTFHQNDHTLVLCYPESYSQLEYIQSRPSIDSTEYYVRSH